MNVLLESNSDSQIDFLVVLEYLTNNTQICNSKQIGFPLPLSCNIRVGELSESTHYLSLLFIIVNKLSESENHPRQGIIGAEELLESENCQKIISV